MDPATKLATGKQKKDEGDTAFKAGEVKQALASYHGALMYLLGLDKGALQSLGIAAPPPQPAAEGVNPMKERTEIDDIVEKIYANMSACHMKSGNWQRAVETATKALAKNENNYKAMFRKGKALGEQGYFDKALKVLEELKKKNPDDSAMVETEIARLRLIDNEREKAASKKLKGFLNKAEKKEAAAAASTSP